MWDSLTVKNTHIYFSHIDTPGAPRKMEAIPGKLVIVNYCSLRFQTKTCMMVDRLLGLRQKKNVKHFSICMTEVQGKLDYACYLIEIVTK